MGKCLSRNKTHSPLKRSSSGAGFGFDSDEEDDNDSGHGHFSDTNSFGICIFIRIQLEEERHIDYSVDLSILHMLSTILGTIEFTQTGKHDPQTGLVILYASCDAVSFSQWTNPNNWSIVNEKLPQTLKLEGVLRKKTPKIITL